MVCQRNWEMKLKKAKQTRAESLNYVVQGACKYVWVDYVEYVDLIPDCYYNIISNLCRVNIMLEMFIIIYCWTYLECIHDILAILYCQTFLDWIWYRKFHHCIAMWINEWSLFITMGHGTQYKWYNSPESLRHHSHCKDDCKNSLKIYSDNILFLQYAQA